MEEDDPKTTPWHSQNCPRHEQDPEAWSRACRELVEGLLKQRGNRRMGDFSRTKMVCTACRFPFVYRTGYYHLGSDADVENFCRCGNPSCRHAWSEWA